MFILKILFASVSLLLFLFVWLCVQDCCPAPTLYSSWQATCSPCCRACADYLLCKKRRHPSCADVPDLPDGTSYVGCVGTWQAVRRKSGDKELPLQITTAAD